MAKYKYPNASGKETFSDNLVGHQTTDGSSLMTNTTFTIEGSIPTKLDKSFNVGEFSEFKTLDDIQKNDVYIINSDVKKEEDVNVVKFINDKDDGANISLFGSLRSRMMVAINNIIEKFPSGIYIDKDSPTKVTANTLYDIKYNVDKDITTFKVSLTAIYNPMELELIPTNNPKDISFWDKYKNYVLVINDIEYNIVSYKYLPRLKEIVLGVKGDINLGKENSESYLIRPSISFINQFYNELDDLESILLNRDTTPKFTATFNIVDNNETEVRKVTFPISRDGYNLKFIGQDYETYLEELLSISEIVDMNKSNLMVRFLSSPQLHEFDTEETKFETILQIYGQSFDKIKKVVDNISYFRNITYDGINNLPDVFLKNNLNLLGFDSVNLISGNIKTKDEENEIYRRLLINLSHLYKRKGTRNAIEFLLKFVGFPKELIKFNETTYHISDIPRIVDLEDKIYDVLNGIHKNIKITYNYTSDLYKGLYDVITEDVGEINYNRDGYPVKKNSYLPQPAYSNKDNIFFQSGAGWYKRTLEHKSREVIDVEKSNFIGNQKNIVRKDKDFTYGEDYFDVFRKLPGLYDGFNLERVNDNKKVSTSVNNLVMNRKNIEILLSPSLLMDYEIYIKSNQLNKSFGFIPSQKNNTYDEFRKFIESTFSAKVRYSDYNNKVVYDEYKNAVLKPYSLSKLNDYVSSFGDKWLNIIEQFIPATTLWVGGVLYENSDLFTDYIKYYFDKGKNKTHEVCYFDGGFKLKCEIVKVEINLITMCNLNASAKRYCRIGTALIDYTGVNRT